MTPIEFYWPPEMLAHVFPERCGCLTTDKSVQQSVVNTQPIASLPYTIDRLPSGCVVIGLPGGHEAWRAAHKTER